MLKRDISEELEGPQPERRQVLDGLLNWLGDHLPSFDHRVNRKVQCSRVVRAARFCFIFTVVLLCLVLPMWNVMSRTRRVFRMVQYTKRRIFRSHSWVHRSLLYHNQSFHQFVLWSLIVATFTWYGVDRDLVQVTRRMGRIAAALMPPLLFLTLRPSPLPETLFLALIPIHKWISRVVVVESLLHSLLYSWFMARKHAFWIKIKKPANMYGVVAMALFLLIGFSSVRTVRRRRFRVFYSVHYISTWLSVILIHFHARPGVPYYTLLNCTILAAQILYRVLHTRTATISVISISDSLALVEFPREALSSKQVLPSGHVRISTWEKNWLKRLLGQVVPLQHPYTIASLPTDETVKLIVRNGKFPLISNRLYYITGAFEPRFTFMKNPRTRTTSLIPWPRPNPFHMASRSLLHSPLNYDIAARRVLMCVGGSAISFALPLLRILNFNGVNVKLIWVVRDLKDLKVLYHFKNNFDGLEIYISGTSGSEQDIQIDYIDCYDDSDTSPHAPSSGVRDPGAAPPMPPTEQASLLENATGSGYWSTGNKRYGPYSVKHSLSGVSCIGSDNANDEIDFTKTFAARNARSQSINNWDTTVSLPMSANNIFRKPSIIEGPASRNSNFGDESYPGEQQRPTDSDTKLKIPSSVKVVFGRPTLGGTEYKWCLQRECDAETARDICCRLNGEDSDLVDSLAEVAVIAAGPPSLIESARRFATDAGLLFHAESFAV
ncbi:hypothetical protein HG536_0E05220 [Torulaspora globosa]|uniref:Ferric oxidoreductase domain-containing protein n=1 Tax=Torulaspora globosa TaxID=48254 RepID=A0A7G3ZJC5_9SACH|nr:uncharacterized protein HG536_0E05220 [Torulaspora globosa]QLL33611.1 hypothetical protein HG536_0E05220 [Torulaspora globosa]